MNLNQVTIPVSDVEKSIEFYTRLGLKLIVKALPDYARFECNEGESTFSIHRSDHTTGIGEGIMVYFELQRLDEYVDDLIEQGFLFEEMPANKPWLWREARLRDPDNNILILYYAGDNRKNPPWKI